MTPLPHNPAITVIDLPEDAKDVEIDNKIHIGYCWLNYPFKYGRTQVAIPPGNYKLICLGNQATEEEARGIVDRYRNGMYMCYTSPARSYREPTASLRSLITSNGWKNPVFLRNV